MYVRQLTALLAVFGAPEITPGLVICQGGLEDLAQSLNFDEALCVFFFFYLFLVSYLNYHIFFKKRVY